MKSCLDWLNLLADLLRFLVLNLRSKSSLAAENLFLRKQLAFYQERKIRPRRIDRATRLTLVWLSGWFNWRSALSARPELLSVGTAKVSGFSGIENAHRAGRGFRRPSNI
jgi:hypothetical protein